MFKFLKEKIQNAISKISSEVEETPEVKVEQTVVKVHTEIMDEEDKKNVLIKLKEKIVKKDEPSTSRLAELERRLEEEKQPKKQKDVTISEEEAKKIEKVLTEEEKKGVFERIKQVIVTKKISEDKFEEMFSDLEIGLIENNVALEVVDKIKNDLKKEIVDKPIKRDEIEQVVINSLKKSIEDLLKVKRPNLLNLIKEKKEKPFIIAFVGVNGSGKTTTISKMANYLQNHHLKCVLAAADTFRSAAIQQLEEHAKNLNVPLVKHDYGADPAAVAFDAIKMAKARNLDVVLIDTAGRQHSNVNLVDEMKKIIRVAKPDLKIYIGEMISGNDCIEQIQQFDSAISIDGAILTKADIDEKGGTAISVSYVTKKPILYLCTGQEYKDIEEFKPEKIMSSLGF